MDKIKKGIKNTALALRFLKSKLFDFFVFDYLYGSKKQYIMKFNDVKAIYSTTDKHSKHWFFPNYSGGKIHEPIVTKMLIDSLNKTDIFVDVGTHLGYFTCIAGKILTKGKVYGFEVDKHAFNLLEKNIELNKLSNVEAFNYGVSDKEGFVKIPKISSPKTDLSLINNESKKDYLSVKAISLDKFFKKKRTKPNVIKIDVEGAELLVLKGMQSLLENGNLTLFLELHGNTLNKFNTDSKEIISFLNDTGYIVYEIVNHRSNNINEKGRLKKLEKDNLIQYNTMCYAIKKFGRTPNLL